MSERSNSCLLSMFVQQARHALSLQPRFQANKKETPQLSSPHFFGNNADFLTFSDSAWFLSASHEYIYSHTSMHLFVPHTMMTVVVGHLHYTISAFRRRRQLLPLSVWSRRVRNYQRRAPSAAFYFATTRARVPLAAIVAAATGGEGIVSKCRWSGRDRRGYFRMAVMTMRAPPGGRNAFWRLSVDRFWISRGGWQRGARARGLSL